MKKICKKCKKLKDLDLFYERKENTDGKTGSCKECIKLRVKLYRGKHRDTISLKKKQYYGGHKEEQANRNKKCKDSMSEEEVFLEKQKSKERRNSRTDEEKQREKEYQQEYQNNNRERLYKQKKKYIKEHIDEQREYKRKYEHKRRAILNNLDEHYTTDEMENLIVESNNKCYWCGCEIGEGDMHIDHYIPLSKGGQIQ